MGLGKAVGSTPRSGIARPDSKWICDFVVLQDSLSLGLLYLFQNYFYGACVSGPQETVINAN